jgi:hypothetical protein
VKTPKVLSLTVARPFHTSLVQYESEAGQKAAKLDIKKFEEDLGKQALKPVPEAVSASSSTRAVAGETSSEHEDDVDMMEGIRADFVGSLRSNNHGTRLTWSRKPSRRRSPCRMFLAKLFMLDWLV